MELDEIIELIISKIKDSKDEKFLVSDLLPDEETDVDDWSKQRMNRIETILINRGYNIVICRCDGHWVIEF